MKIPEWVSPGLYGAVAGAIALAIVGFTWGGWMTAGQANKVASSQARMEVVAALVPICLEQFKQDPQAATTLAELEKASSNYERTNMLMSTGWATIPGSSDPNRNVASACVEKLAAQF